MAGYGNGYGLGGQGQDIPMQDRAHCKCTPLIYLRINEWKVKACCMYWQSFSLDLAILCNLVKAMGV